MRLRARACVVLLLLLAGAELARSLDEADAAVGVDVLAAKSVL